MRVSASVYDERLCRALCRFSATEGIRLACIFFFSMNTFPIFQPKRGGNIFRLGAFRFNVPDVDKNSPRSILEQGLARDACSPQY